MTARRIAPAALALASLITLVVVARTIGEKMITSLGQNIVFDNRGGGGGMIGTVLVARS